MKHKAQKIASLLGAAVITLAFMGSVSANCFTVTPASDDFLPKSDINPDWGRSIVMLTWSATDASIKKYGDSKSYNVIDMGSWTCADVRSSATGEVKMMLDISHFQGKLYEFFGQKKITAPGLKSMWLSVLGGLWAEKYIPYAFNDGLSWDTIFSEKTDMETIMPKMSADRLTVMSLFFAIVNYQEWILATYR